MFRRSRENPLFGRKVELAPPPRAVTTAARLVVVFGGAANVAFLVAGFLSIFFWVFSWDSEAVTRFEFRGEMAVVQGTVTKVYETNASENKRRVTAAVFAYEVGGKKLEGESFTTGSPPAPGSSVSVEYLTRDPSIGRIAGMRRRKFGISGGFFGVIPIIATVVSLVLVARGVRKLPLLRRGQLGFAKLVESKPTGGTVNKRPVVAYTFELELPTEATPANYRGAWTQWAKTHRFTVKTHSGSKISDDALEPVLFEPTKPGSGVPLDLLPLGPTPEGGLDTTENALLHLLLPVLFFGINGAVIVSKLI